MHEVKACTNVIESLYPENTFGLIYQTTSCKKEDFIV
jgi:hypothetical protein